jgi:hypothetical protein
LTLCDKKAAGLRSVAYIVSMHTGGLKELVKGTQEISLFYIQKPAVFEYKKVVS